MSILPQLLGCLALADDVATYRVPSCGGQASRGTPATKTQSSQTEIDRRAWPLASFDAYGLREVRLPRTMTPKVARPLILAPNSQRSSKDHLILEAINHGTIEGVILVA